VHYLIGILTEGETRREARAHAVAFADELVTRGEYDFYDAHRARTYKLASALGKKAVAGALAANRREFDTALRAVQLMLQEFTDEQIYQDDYPLSRVRNMPPAGNSARSATVVRTSPVMRVSGVRRFATRKPIKRLVLIATIGG
jgi:hypothetical protein